MTLKRRRTEHEKSLEDLNPKRRAGDAYQRLTDPLHAPALQQ